MKIVMVPGALPADLARSAFRGVFGDPEIVAPDRADRIAESIDRHRPGLLVIDAASWLAIGPAGVGAVFDNHPDLRVLVPILSAIGRSKPDGLGELLALGNTDFIERTSAYDLLVHRIRRLMLGAPVPETVDSVAALHHPRSGRLDAVRIADFLDLPLTEFVAPLSRPYRTVHKTPDAESLQSLLVPYRELIRDLFRAHTTPRDVRIWLRSRRADLGGRSPLEAIRAGDLDKVRSAAVPPDPPSQAG